jgi:hypothetical protein
LPKVPVSQKFSGVSPVALCGSVVVFVQRAVSPGLRLAVAGLYAPGLGDDTILMFTSTA